MKRAPVVTNRQARCNFGPTVPLRRRRDSLPVPRDDYYQPGPGAGRSGGLFVASHDSRARTGFGGYASGVHHFPDDRLRPHGRCGRRM